MVQYTNCYNEYISYKDGSTTEQLRTFIILQLYNRRQRYLKYSTHENI